MDDIRKKIPKIEKILSENLPISKKCSLIIGMTIIEDDYEHLVDENPFYGEFCELCSDLEVEPRNDTFFEAIESFEKLKKSLK